MELPAKPGHINNLEFVRILTPYVFSLGTVKRKSVLDVGCGFGHGTWLLLKAGADRVVALDVNTSRAAQVSRLCADLKRGSVLAMDAERLAFKDRSFEVVTCFEVIEHVLKPGMLLCELRRVLKENGVLLLSTPNRGVRLLPLQRPWNPEHLREYGLKAFQRSLRTYFRSFKVLGILGDRRPHEFYTERWRQRPLDVYLGGILPALRRVTPGPVARWIRARRNRQGVAGSPGPIANLTDIRVPSPGPENWPFHVGDVNPDCLNFLAVCGLDDRVVEGVADQIKMSKS
jgi:SAM-dependent methyltransferase